MLLRIWLRLLLLTCCALACGAAVGVPGVAWARPLAEAPRAEAGARKQFEQGIAELEAGHVPKARELFESAYARAPLPEVLHQLGRIAEEQHEEVAAADLYKRYLSTLPDSAMPELRERLAKLLARVRSQASELDVSSQDLGALLKLDGHMVGILPLGAPLLVSAGPHRFQVLKGAQRFETNVLTIPPAQHVQLQLAVASRYAVLTLSSGIALLLDPADASAPIQAQLDKAIAAVAVESTCFLIERETITAALNKLEPVQRSACAQRQACQEQLARALDASFVLSLTLSPSAAAPSKIELKLLDAGTGVPAGSAELANPSGSAEALPNLLTQPLHELLEEAVNRGRGTLQVTSEPAGAKVLIAGRELGQTPYTREAFEGPLEVALELEGYEPYKKLVQIARGEPTSIQAILQPIPPEPVEPAPAIVAPEIKPAPAARRPRWRLATGGALLAGGLGLSGFGISALVVSGQCTQEIVSPAQLCDYTYSTRSVGSGLLSAGVAITIAGAALLAWPAR